MICQYYLRPWQMEGGMSKATCFHGSYIPVGGETDNKEATRLWKWDKAMKTQTRLSKGGEGPGSCPPQVSGVQGQLTLTGKLITSSASHLQWCYKPGPPFPGAGCRHGAAQHRRGARWRSLWRDTRGEVNPVTLWGKEKASPETLKQNWWETKKDEALCFKMRTEFCYRTTVIYSNCSK